MRIAREMSFNFILDSKECGLRERYRSILYEIRASADCTGDIVQFETRFKRVRIAQKISFNCKRDSSECGFRGKYD